MASRKAILAARDKVVAKRIEGAAALWACRKNFPLGEKWQAQPESAKASEFSVKEDVIQCPVGDGRKPCRGEGALLVEETYMIACGAKGWRVYHLLRSPSLLGI